MATEDLELIRQAQKGVEGAFERLVARYDRQVFAIAAQYVRSADDAKDIYQEVFLRVYRSIGKFRFGSEFSTWLYRITANCCLTHRSHHRRHHHQSIDDLGDPDDHRAEGILNDHSPERSPEQMTIGSDISQSIDSALGSLSPRQRLVFTMRHYQGYKLREIAEIMKCAEGTVKRYLFSATQRMRDELKEYILE
jgi:RNA polymerase sigma-70 factor, ECF subfamily